MQDRAANERRVTLEAQRATKEIDIPFDAILLSNSAKELVRLPAPTRSTHAGDRDLHAVVSPGDVHREIAAHRIPVDAEPLWIDFGLLLQKRQRAPATEREQVPVVVFRMLAIFEDLQRPRQDRVVVSDVELTRIDRTPIGIGITRLSTLDRIERSLPRRSAPVHRQPRVPARHQQLHFTQEGPLPATVNVHDRR